MLLVLLTNGSSSIHLDQPKNKANISTFITYIRKKKKTLFFRNLRKKIQHYTENMT